MKKKLIPASPLLVTRPFMPPIEEYYPFLQDIWESGWLTNNGKHHQSLERELCEYLGVKHVSLFANGTLALITALQALQISGEVITTPYSFVATSHALMWNNIKPVFVDIEPTNFNIDPAKIEAAITPKTTAILPVHVYGNPCKMRRIQEIADAHGLRVIYDAAHAFGVKEDGKSILNDGDLSVLSFHATKVFNTFEGGAIICHDEETKKHIDSLKNFGFKNEITVVTTGINAKMNEVQAAMGLLQLRYIDKAILLRKNSVARYNELLGGESGLSVIRERENVQHNYSYYPIMVNRDEFGRSRDELYNILRELKIFARRYFYPLISEFPPYKKMKSTAPRSMPVAEKAASEVICLPLYPGMDDGDLQYIGDCIKRSRR
jgi:dTDP-4-amino-4,6-dideoxygalactose transaminase